MNVHFKPKIVSSKHITIFQRLIYHSSRMGVFGRNVWKFLFLNFDMFIVQFNFLFGLIHVESGSLNIYIRYNYSHFLNILRDYTSSMK